MNDNSKRKRKIRAQTIAAQRRLRMARQDIQRAEDLVRQPEHEEEHPYSWRLMGRREKRVWKLVAEMRAKRLGLSRPFTGGKEE